MPLLNFFLFSLLLDMPPRAKGTQAKKKTNNKKWNYIICSLRRFSSLRNERKQSKKIVGRGALGRQSNSVCRLVEAVGHSAIASCTENKRSRHKAWAFLAACEQVGPVRLHVLVAKLYAWGATLRKDSDGKWKPHKCCLSVETMERHCVCSNCFLAKGRFELWLHENIPTCPVYNSFVDVLAFQCRFSTKQMTTHTKRHGMSAN